jgi:hypothetical protein
MDLKEFGQALAKIGLPLLGAALPIPGGMAIGTALASAIGSSSDNPEDILTALSANADAMAKAKQFELTHQETMLKMTLDSQIAQLEAVNKTLQTEAMGGSWLQKNHHALESMFTVTLVGAIYFLLPVLSLPVPPVPESAWIMLGGILGVTAWQRGQANVATAKQP